jgi:hypothetical protein
LIKDAVKRKMCKDAILKANKDIILSQRFFRGNGITPGAVLASKSKLYQAINNELQVRF